MSINEDPIDTSKRQVSIENITQRVCASIRTLVHTNTQITHTHTHI